MADFVAGNQNPYESLAGVGEGMRQVLNLADVTGFSRLMAEYSTDYKPLSQVIERISEDVRPLNEYLMHSGFNRVVTQAIGRLDQQWAKPLSDMGRQVNLRWETITNDMDVAAKALAKIADAEPKSHITVAHVDAANYYLIVITRNRRLFLSD